MRSDVFMVVVLVGWQLLSGCGAASGEWSELDPEAQSTGAGGPVASVGDRLALGKFNGCILRSDGRVECDGEGLEGVSAPEDGAFVSISAAGLDVCGLRRDGTVRCWGIHSLALPGTYTDIDVGDKEVCGVEVSGTLTCFPDALASVPGSFTEVETDGHRVCAIGVDGSLTCWVLGSPTPLIYGTPKVGSFSQLAVGSFHECALSFDGTVQCWGDNSESQLSSPADSFVQLSAHGTRTCGLRSDGTVACWGADRSGVPAPEGVFDEVRASSAGVCAAGADGVVCSGLASAPEPTPEAQLATATSLGPSPNCGAYVGSDAFLCAIKIGWLEPYGFTTANVAPFSQQFGPPATRNVWISDTTVTLPDGQTTTAKSIYTAIDPNDTTSQVSVAMPVGTMLLHHNVVGDRLGMMVKRAPGSFPQQNDWEFLRFLYDGTPASTDPGPYGLTCVECHTMDGRQQRTDMLWGVPRAVVSNP